MSLSIWYSYLEQVNGGGVQKAFWGFAWGRDKASNKPLSFPILEKYPPEFKATKNSREV